MLGSCYKSSLPIEAGTGTRVAHSDVGLPIEELRTPSCEALLARREGDGTCSSYDSCEARRLRPRTLLYLRWCIRSSWLCRDCLSWRSRGFFCAEVAGDVEMMLVPTDSRS